VRQSPWLTPRRLLHGSRPQQMPIPRVWTDSGGCWRAPCSSGALSCRTRMCPASYDARRMTRSRPALAALLSGNLAG